MAFAEPVSGDRFGARAGSVVPKKPGSAYTTPLVGHLVKQDTSANDSVVQCSASDVPQYLVESVNSSNGTLSCMILKKSVQLVFEYAGSPTRGQGIQMNDPAVVGTIKIGGNVRDKVKGYPPPPASGSSRRSTRPPRGLLTVEFGAN
jgi:hypothetical protein